MARPRKAVIEGDAGYPVELVSVKTGDDLQSIVDGFKLCFPEHWEQIRLCPLEYGLNDMIEALSR